MIVMQRRYRAEGKKKSRRLGRNEGIAMRARRLERG